MSLAAIRAILNIHCLFVYNIESLTAPCQWHNLDVLHALSLQHLSSPKPPCLILQDTVTSAAGPPQCHCAVTLSLTVGPELLPCGKAQHGASHIEVGSSNSIHCCLFPAPSHTCLQEPTLTWGMCRNAESCNQVTVRRANEFPVPAAVAKFTFASSKWWGCSEHRDQQCCSTTTSQIYSSQGRRWAWHNSLPGQTSGAALEIKHCTAQWLQPLVYATTPAQIIFLSWILVSWA